MSGVKVKINNKIFKAKYDRRGKLIIPLDNDFDKLFFKKWQNKTKGENGKLSYKNDYVEDVDFVKVTERGVLRSCFPVLSMNEDFVTLWYDLYEVITEN